MKSTSFAEEFKFFLLCEKKEKCDKSLAKVILT